MTNKEAINLIRTKADIVLRREIMEANCLNYTDLADRMCKHIITICDNILEEKYEKI